MLESKGHWQILDCSVLIPKFALLCCNLVSELWNRQDTNILGCSGGRPEERRVAPAQERAAKHYSFRHRLKSCIWQVRASAFAAVLGSPLGRLGRSFSFSSAITIAQ